MSSRTDDDLRAAIAASLRASYQAEQAARANPPPPRPVAPVPDWLFGPRHRELDIKRRAARDIDRDIKPVNVMPEKPRPAICPSCQQPLPLPEGAK